jgi:hypothetical protein
MTLERLTYLRDYFSVFRELPHGAMEEIFESLEVKLTEVAPAKVKKSKTEVE